MKRVTTRSLEGVPEAMNVGEEGAGVLQASAERTQAASDGKGAASHHVALPDKPLVTIEPSKTWVALNLRDLWTYRELFYFLTWRDVKVRYKQTLLGAAWA